MPESENFNKILEKITGRLKEKPELMELSPFERKEEIKKIYLTEIAKEKKPQIEKAPSKTKSKILLSNLESINGPRQRAKVLAKYALETNLFEALGIAKKLDMSTLDSFHDEIVDHLDEYLDKIVKRV